MSMERAVGEFKYKKNEDGSYSVTDIIERPELRSCICEITEDARKVFGDGLINRAYLKCDIYLAYLKEGGLKEKLEEIINRSFQYLDSTDVELSMDNIDFIVEFSNGVVVTMSNSEWCSIRRMKSLPYALSGTQVC